MADKHKVLLFGERVFGGRNPTLTVDYCEVEAIRFPSEDLTTTRLCDYDLIILDYSAFFPNGNTHYGDRQEIFEKEMSEALNRGSHFCILHYNEDTPDEVGAQKCEETQIGYRWLTRHLGGNFHAIRSNIPPLDITLKSNEFQVYHSSWGESKNVFKVPEARNLTDIICLRQNDKYSGFVLAKGRGKILFLPCQRNFHRPDVIDKCLTVLINSTITYLSRSSTEIPPWASTPLFEKETDLQTELSELQSKVQILKNELEPYDIAKRLAFLSEYELEKAVPDFINTHLGIATEREERYIEDFWILDSNLQRIVIAEIKSYVRGFTKKGIHSLYDHRDNHNLGEEFPALLVVNAHLNANSWKDKIRPIDPQDYQIAAQYNILIVRIEDLLFFWNLIVTGQKSTEDLLSSLLTERGWLEVQISGEIQVQK